jgi:hypothetical protein
VPPPRRNAPGRRRKAQAALSRRQSCARPSATLPAGPRRKRAAWRARTARWTDLPPQWNPQVVRSRGLRPSPARTRPRRTQVPPRAARARDRESPSDAPCPGVSGTSWPARDRIVSGAMMGAAAFSRFKGRRDGAGKAQDGLNLVLPGSPQFYASEPNSVENLGIARNG